MVSELSEPLTPLSESAAAARELYEAYLAQGFDEGQALFLTGCVVSSVGARMATEALIQYQEVAATMGAMPDTSQPLDEEGHNSLFAEWHRRTGGTTSPNVGRFCDEHQLPFLERIGPDGTRQASCPACDLAGSLADRRAAEEAAEGQPLEPPDWMGDAADG